MNRRLRTLTRPSQSKLDERLHRFLRPGALARLRDSRIISRFPRSDLKNPNPSPISRLSPPSSPSPAPTGTHQIDAFPCFVARIYGPRFPQRKKLVAAKSIYFVGPIPSSPAGPDPSESILDVFNADLVVAH